MIHPALLEDEGEGSSVEELSKPYVFQEGCVDHFYPAGIRSFDTPTVSSQVVYITRLEGHLLVAVPFTAWHRLRANRALPPNTLSKVTAAVEAAMADPDDRMNIHRT